MTTRTVEQVDDWQSRSFAGGYRGLHDLADEEFSGIVTAGSARLCMTKGTVVGILGGEIEEFEDRGTAREAPSPALPLLAVMQERSDEVRAQYYTEDTPISEVDQTLSDGNFTGYIELSENVLSGDYYIVYHQGRSMHVAWVGESQQLLTEDEAENRTNDEVGIYKVRPVDIDIIEIPEPPEPEESDTDEESDDAASSPAAQPAESDESAGSTEPGEPDDPAESTESTEPAEPDAASTQPPESPTSESRGSGGGSQATGQANRQPSRAQAEQRGQAGESRDSSAEQAGQTATAQQKTRQREDKSVDPASDLETRSIPSLDPGRTSQPATEDDAESTADIKQPDRSSGQAQTRSQQSANSAPQQSATQQSAQQQSTPQQRDPPGGEENAADSEPTQQLEAELDELRTERDELESKLADVQTERDELRERVEQLERRISDLQGDDGDTAGGRQLSPQEVIDGTNLFVRYDSKGAATLESAYNGVADADAVNENLDIQHHTQFETADVTVDGEPFETFLYGTLHYQFLEWVIRVLPYEIRDTGHQESLGDLYDTLPSVDRAELNGTISVPTADGETEPQQFDIVLRDRMGNPLVVTNLHESRDPASQSLMESLITSAQRVADANDSLAGAVLVTSSFFEPDAMEAAESATGSGLLSRDKRESFVKLTRKDGFHLCLVQYLDGQFELSVPEL